MAKYSRPPKRKATFKPAPKPKPKPQQIRPVAPPPPVYAPWSPPAAQPQALAPDATYNDQLGINQRDYDTGIANIGHQRTQLSQDYGYAWDPTLNNGMGGISGLDTSNPYNRATMLQRSYQQGQRGTNTSYAAQGQLYAGSYQRGLDEGTHQYSRNEDSLKRQATGAFDQLRQAEQGLKSAKDQGDLDAFNAWLERSKGIDPVPPPDANTAATTHLQATYPNGLTGFGSGSGHTAGLKRDAERYWNAGNRKGPQWRLIIDQLGYDPRQGGRLVFR